MDLNRIIRELKQRGLLRDDADRLRRAREQVNAACSEQAPVLHQLARDVAQVRRDLDDRSEQVDQLADGLSRCRREVDLGAAAATGVSHRIDELLALQIQLDSALTLIEGIHRRTQVIQEIAEKSNILSINASIEASRAGPAGAGFLVVAEAMRELAEESKVATERILGSLSEGVDGISSSGRAVRGGLVDAREAVAQAVTGFDSLSGGLTELESLVGEVRSTVRADQRTVGHLDDNTRKTIAWVAGLKRQLAEGLADRIEAVEPETGFVRDYLIVDIRPRAAFAAGHIASARNVPFDELEGWLAHTERDARYLFVSQDEPSAREAANLAMRFEFTAVAVLTGGMRQWAARQQPTVSDPAPV